MNAAYHIAVLLTCHNRKEKTLACLEALFQNHLPERFVLEVFLVDDDSTDDTSFAVKATYKEINLIQGNGALFWNRGMILAWESAIKKKDYDYYLWLNDDTTLVKSALNILLEYSQVVDNKKILVGATCSAINGALTYSGFNFPQKKLYTNGTWQNCDYFNGNIVLIPSFIYSKVGLLDNSFHHALGDFDYGMRASKLGFIHALSPHCIGYCEDHVSEPIWRNHSIPLHRRLKSLYSPLGNNPFEFFIFDRRHNGLFFALLHFISIHFRSLFPFIWKIKI